MTQDDLLAALQAHGVDARDVRDGAHEACHALAWGVPTPWTRENISEAAPDRFAGKFRAECVARAVEQLVCESVGAECADIEDRACTAAMEALKFDGYSVPRGLGMWVRVITDCLTSDESKGLAARILALANTES